MIDKSWHKWIKNSIKKYFRTYTPFQVWTQGDTQAQLQDIIQQNERWVELRISIPNIRRLPANQTYLDILITATAAQKENDNSDALESFIGEILEMFTDSILIYKLGDQLEDDLELFGCLRFNPDIDQNILTNNWGVLNPEDKISYCGIEGYYRIEP